MKIQKPTSTHTHIHLASRWRRWRRQRQKPHWFIVSALRFILRILFIYLYVVFSFIHIQISDWIENIYLNAWRLNFEHSWPETNLNWLESCSIHHCDKNRFYRWLHRITEIKLYECQMYSDSTSLRYSRLGSADVNMFIFNHLNIEKTKSNRRPFDSRFVYFDYKRFAKTVIHTVDAQAYYCMAWMWPTDNNSHWTENVDGLFPIRHCFM